MKLTFLGTSHGAPAPNRFCSCTMLEEKDGIYLVDAGAPVIDLLLRRNVELERIKALFTTHLHGDHVDGILSYADLINWYYRNVHTKIFLTEEKGIRLFKELLSAVSKPIDEDRLHFELMTPETVYSDENIRVTPFPTKHLGEDRPSYAYLVEADGRKVIFSGDLSSNLTGKDFPAYALENRVDVLILEMAHFGIDAVTPYLERCQANLVLFNHVAARDDRLRKIKELNGIYGYEIRAAEDGETVEI